MENHRFLTKKKGRSSHIFKRGKRARRERHRSFADVKDSSESHTRCISTITYALCHHVKLSKDQSVCSQF